MLKRFKQFAKNVSQTVRAKAQAVKAAVQMQKVQLTASAHTALAGTAAESYVDTGVKILIAVVIGALLLGLLYALFNGTIMPKVTEKVTGLFNYNG